MLLELKNNAAFFAVWTALNQFVDNQEDVDDESEWPETVRVQVAEARRMIAVLDKAAEYVG